MKTLRPWIENIGGIFLAVALFAGLIACGAKQGLPTPTFVVNPEFEMSGYIPEHAKDIIGYYIERYGGKLSPNGQKLKIKADLAINLYGGRDRAYMSENEPNTVSVSLELGNHKIHSYSEVGDISPEAPMKVQVSLYGAAVSSAFKQLTHEIEQKRKQNGKSL